MMPEQAFNRLVESIDVYDESINLTHDEMCELGILFWMKEVVDEKETGKALWLFPLSYYPYITPGFPIVDIFFKRKVFQPHTTNKDDRFGLLSFGVLGRAKSL